MWLRRDSVSFMLHLQKHGRAFFAVNELGGRPTPPDDPVFWRNHTLAIPQAQRQLVLALYLLGKQQAAPQRAELQKPTDCPTMRRKM